MGERYKSFGMKGKKHSLKTIQKMRTWHKKHPVKFWLGKKMSKEHRDKLSKVRKAQFKAGRKQWNIGLSELYLGENLFQKR